MIIKTLSAVKRIAMMLGAADFRARGARVTAPAERELRRAFKGESLP